MKKLFCLIFPLLISAASDIQLNYPKTKTVEASDTYFGKTYFDPYRWLENMKDKEVITWFSEQSKLTDDLMAKIPGRDALLQEWLDLDKLKVANYSAMNYKNGRIFYKKTLGGRDNVGKLYFREGWDGAEKLLFDPGTYKTAGVTTIQRVIPSLDGHYVLLGFSSGGAEYSEIRILDVDQGKLLSESIYPSLGPIGWTPDSKSFFYDAGKVTDIKSLEIELNRKTRLHRLGTDISTDIDFFSNESYPELEIEPKEFPAAFINEHNPDYIIGRVDTVQRERKVYYANISEMKKDKIKWNILCQASDNLIKGLIFHGNFIYAVSHSNANRYKVIRTSVKHPDWNNAETVIPEKQFSIKYITRSKDFLFIAYGNRNFSSFVKYNFITGESSMIKRLLPGTADIWCLDWKTNNCNIRYTSWTDPVTIYDFDAENDTFSKSIFNSDVTYPGFENLVVEEVEVPGYDGTGIPLSIIYHKSLLINGNNSCILEGYGAYGISMTPHFSILRSIALKGVILAYAHTRGGSEKGESWYKAGYKTTKPNTWKDFISCAEYLIKKGYTSLGKIAGTGTSAGGILISRAITERPDLFSAAVCNVGVANAMRNEFTPNGPINTPEFGTVKDPIECQALYEMDGVQHVKKGVNYPAVLCVAGWNDPRVIPWQPGKFAAAIQNASASGKPALMKVNYDSGHFTEEKIVTFKNFADQYSFLLWQTGHKDFQLKK
jgi:prolyl oligopeptidase